jgi:YHS domain-containing protein
MEKDPVCGMVVSQDDVGGRSEYREKTYFFCSPMCKEKFDSEPELYVLRRLSDEGRRSSILPDD